MTNDRPRLSRRKRAFFALALALAPLFFLEAMFRVTGVFGPEEPFSIVRDDRGVEMVQYNWNQVKPRFPPEKLGGTLRVMVFGGSTALGFPYQPRSSFGEMLAVMLEHSLPGLRVELINLGRVGMNSAEVAELLPRALEYQPDLVIVYSGHNEFIALDQGQLWVWASRTLGRVRTARAAGTVIKLGLGAAALSLQERVEPEPLAPPPASRVSEADFEEALVRYRQNLEAMAAACKEKKIPLALNTLTSNLAGWPPEDRVFPEGVPKDAQEQALEVVALVKDLCFQVRSRPGQGLTPEEVKARELLEQASIQAPGYAPLRFWSARLDLAGQVASSRLTDPPRDLLAAFNRALSEEAHTVSVHRAPPEINRIVRAVAKEQGLILAEHKWLGISLGLFDDHCHPGLQGQAEIARGIYTALLDEGFPRPPTEWSAYEFDLERFKADRKLDETFIHDIRVRMGVFLGLERDLPLHSELTRRQLKEAIATGPDDPLPALLLAAVHLHYGETAEAAAALKPWRKKQDRIQLALDRYFTRSVDLRGGALYFHLALDPGVPPLRGLLTSGIARDEKPRVRPGKPLPLSAFNARIDLN